jgi:hypothetical protein
MKRTLIFFSLFLSLVLAPVSGSAQTIFGIDKIEAEKILVKPSSEVTIASGAAPVTGSHHTVDSESDAASDDLVTLSGGEDGMTLILRPASDDRTIVVKRTGNIAGAADVTLDDATDLCALVYDGTASKWLITAIGAAGGGGGGVTTFVNLTDVPNSFSSEGGNLVRVNSGESALEFVDGSTLFVEVSALIDDDSMATATASTVSSSESIKAYVDANSGGSGSMTTVQEGDVGVGGSDIVTLDFLGADFDLTESPDTEVNVVISSALTRDAEWDTAAEINAATTDEDFLVESLLIDDDSMATATASNIASAESIKAYVDANAAGDVVDDTSPQLGGDLDGNGFDILLDNTTGIRTSADDEGLMLNFGASPVNYLELWPAATGQPVLLLTDGSDSNVGLRLQGKGSGAVEINDVLWIDEQAEPATPSSGFLAMYATASGALAIKNDAGSVTTLGAGGGSGTMTTIEEGDSGVGGADIVTLDFNGSDFDLSESPDTEVNVVIASALTRDAEWDTAAEINAATTDEDFVVESAIGSTVQQWDDDLDDLAGLDPTKGNLLVGDGTDWISVGVGTNNQVLTADSAEASGIKWAAAAGGGSGSVTTIEEGDSGVGDADIVTLDFNGSDFDLSESPDTEVNFSIAAAITRDAEWDTAAEINAATTDEDFLVESDLGSTVQDWDDDLDDLAALTPTKGNLLVGDGTDWVSVGVGTNNQVLTADSAQASGIKWAAAAGGGSGSVTTIEEGDSGVGDADIVTLDFNGSDFDLSESPDTEVNFSIASAITRDAEWDTLAEINAATTDDDAAGLAASNAFSGANDFSAGTLEIPQASGITLSNAGEFGLHQMGGVYSTNGTPVMEINFSQEVALAVFDRAATPSEGQVLMWGTAGSIPAWTTASASNLNLGALADLDTVGTSYLDNDAVTSAKIDDGTIVAADIANGTITGAKLATTYQTADADLDDLADGSLTGSKVDLSTADGDVLDIDFTPTNYTPDATPAAASDVDDLTAHLQGIDTAIGAAGGGGGSVPASVDLASDYTIDSTTTWSTVTGMSVAVEANKSYLVKVTGSYVGETSTDAPWFGLSGPSGATISRGNVKTWSSTSASRVEVLTGFDQSLSQTISGGTTSQVFELEAKVNVSSTAGNVSLRLRSETGTNDITAEAGTHMTVTEVAAP